MPNLQSVPKIGVEEEYQLVDPLTGLLTPDCRQVMQRITTQPESEIQHELHLNQIEMASPVCKTLDEARTHLTEVRRLLGDSARRVDTALVAAGTNPFAIPDSPDTTPLERYQQMTQRYQQIARDLLIFGCHVHVEMPDRELGLQVMNRARRWLPLLQALTANSPYWNDADTGYASYRREIWSQWPMAGPPPHFDTFPDYEKCIEALMGVKAIPDASHIYWDIRLPTKVPTIEFRVADVCTQVEETVGFAAVVRAIVMQATTDIHDGRNYNRIDPYVLSYAMWHAARYGTSDQLIDPDLNESVTAGKLVDRLLRYLRPSLEHSKSTEIVSDYLHNMVVRENGASRQRRLVRETPHDDNSVPANYLPMVRQLILETAGEGILEPNRTDC